VDDHPAGGPTEGLDPEELWSLLIGDPTRVDSARRLLPDASSLPGLDRSTRLAARLLSAVGSQVTLITDRTVVASEFGIVVGGGEHPTAAMCARIVFTGEPVAVSDRATDPRVAHIPAEVVGPLQAYLGVPVETRDGVRVGALCVFDDKPRAWTEDDIAIMTELSGSISDSLQLTVELATRMTQLDVGFAAANVGSFDWDLASGELRYDTRLHAMFGTTPDTVKDMDSFIELVHVDDRERLRAAFEESITGQSDYVQQHRMLTTTGDDKWIAARGRVVLDTNNTPVRFLGAALDVTSIRSAQERVTRVLEALGTPFMTLDNNWIVTYANAACADAIGVTTGQLIDHDIWELLPTTMAEYRHHYERAADDQQPVTFEAYDQTLGRWLEVRLFPSTEGIAVYFNDVTASVRSEEDRIAAVEEALNATEARRAAEARLELIADAGQALAAAFDLPTVIDTALALVVPAVAPAAMIHILNEDSLSLVGARHHERWVEDLMTKVFGAVDQLDAHPIGIGHVVTHGQTSVFAMGTTDDFARLLPGDTQSASALIAAGITGAIAVPLSARGRTLGVLSLAWSAPEIEWYHQGDAVARAHVTLVEQLAVRIALAIDNGRLYTEAQQARASAEQSGRQLALLSEVSQALSSTLDAEESVGRLARLVVPWLADWCIVTLVDEDGQLSDVGRWHRDAESRDALDRYASLRIESSRSAAPVRRVIETGQPVVIPDVDMKVIENALHNTAAREALVALRPGSSVELPMRGRGRTLGAVTLVNSDARGPATPDEIAFGMEVARRAGLAVDNAQLFSRQRAVSEMLQHSLLTDPPKPDNLQIEVRYRPAASNVQVGGDWYDAFLQPDGSTMLVIGDVMGHDIGAAAAMGQIRSLVRGIAFDRQDSPAGVLRRVDLAMAGLEVGTLATAVIARIEEPEGDHTPGTRQVRWSSAGHPQPMLIDADGTVRDLEAEPNVLLGVMPESERYDNLAVLPVGGTLLLFTDGLFERRRLTIDEGLARVRGRLRLLGELPLEQLCDALLDDLLEEEPEDDVALVAVRAFGPSDHAFTTNQPGSDAGRSDPAASVALAEFQTHPDLHAPARCRRFVDEFLAASGVTVSDIVRFDVELVTTELVTNAINAGTGLVTVGVTLGTGWMQVDVTDDVPGVPDLRDAAVTDLGGRGLAIVAATAIDWGYELISTGKSVWARIAIR
jgi:PAS domain S-box-containing protein